MCKWLWAKVAVGVFALGGLMGCIHEATPSATPPPTRLRNAAPTAEAPEQIVAARAAFETALGRALPAHFPTPRQPTRNPATREKVELGRWLFYDLRLSGNGTQACSSCHQQARAFTDGRATAVGSTGAAHPRNSMSLTNVAYNGTLDWANPNVTELEIQILTPLFGSTPVEMGIRGNEAAVLARLRNTPHTRALFDAAFPQFSGERVDWPNIELALSAFVRTLISSNSPYDRYVAGDATALSEAALRGKKLFESEALGCTNCHGGFNFSTSSVWRGSPNFRPFANTGLYNIGNTGAYPSTNSGLHEHTGALNDTGKMRPPTLRNLIYTAPYNHDGSVTTLEDVIRNYARGGRNIETGPLAGDGKLNPFKNGQIQSFAIDPPGIVDLVEFLRALSDEDFVHDPALSDPFAR